MKDMSLTLNSFRLLFWNRLEDTESVRNFYGTENMIREVDGYMKVIFDEYLNQIKTTDPTQYIDFCLERDFAEDVPIED